MKHRLFSIALIVSMLPLIALSQDFILELSCGDLSKNYEIDKINRISFEDINANEYEMILQKQDETDEHIPAEKIDQLSFSDASGHWTLQIKLTDQGVNSYDAADLKAIKVMKISGAPESSVILKPVRSYPNPSSEGVTLEFSLEKPLIIECSICDNAGRTVKFFPGQFFDKGTHKICWDMLDEEGNTVPSGVYWFVVHSGKDLIVKKAVKF